MEPLFAEHTYDRLALGHRAPKDDAVDLTQVAAKFGQSAQLRPTIEYLASLSFRQGQFPEEFKKNFCDPQKRVSAVLVRGFVDALRQNIPPSATFLAPATAVARADAYVRLRAFIEHYKTHDHPTLHDWIQTERVAHPFIDFASLFDDALVAALVDAIDFKSSRIADQVFLSFFERDREHFLTECLFRRVLSFDSEGIARVDEAVLSELIDFLHGTSYNLDDLYNFLYDRIADFSHIHQTRSSTRNHIAGVTPDAVSPPHTSSASILHQDFDFDSFFQQYFLPPILNKRKRSSYRVVDILGTLTPQQLRQHLYPDESWISFERDFGNFDTNKSGNGDMEKLRAFFNYGPSPEEDADQSEFFTDEEILYDIACGLESVEKQIRYSFQRALEFKQGTNMSRDCVYPQELLKCRDIRFIISCIVRPAIFFEKYPQYLSSEARVQYSEAMIRHVARRMFDHLLFMRTKLNTPEMANRKLNRDKLQQHISYDLQISKAEIISSHPVHYRVKYEIDTSDDPVGGSPAYHLDYIDDHDYLSNLGQLQQLDLEIITDENGREKYFVLLPVETKSFKKITFSVPHNGDGREGATFWVFSGDRHLFHAKGAEASISSLLRDKEVTDPLRWTLIPAGDSPNVQKKSSELMKNYLYGHYSCTKVEDKAEERKLGREGADTRRRGPGSVKFSKERPFTISARAILSRRKKLSSTDSGEPFQRMMDQTEVTFETQMWNNLEQYLLASSDFTDTSHRAHYIPQREFQNLFDYYFPPAIWGKKYADYRREGYTHRLQHGEIIQILEQREREKTGERS